MIKYSAALTRAWELYNSIFKGPYSEHADQSWAATARDRYWVELRAIMDIPSSMELSKADKKLIAGRLIAFGRKEGHLLLIKEKGIEVGDTIFLQSRKGIVQKVHESGYLTLGFEGEKKDLIRTPIDVHKY